jgi:hypothetical protein
VQHEGLGSFYGARGLRPFLMIAPLLAAPLTRCFIGGGSSKEHHADCVECPTKPPAEHTNHAAESARNMPKSILLISQPKAANEPERS